MRLVALILAAVGCGAASAPPAPPLESWRIPAEWKAETIPFPLAFAPSLAHQGIEELRFAPGFFKPGTPGYWSYAFTWRTRDAAQLDAAALSGELTTYFRGLLAAVAADRKQAIDPAAIRATATASGPARFTLTAHVLDTFGSGAAVELTGHARREACGAGALWVFVLAPASSSVQAALDALAAEAVCGQPT